MSSSKNVGSRSRDNKTALTQAPTTGRARASGRPAKGEVKAGPHN